MKLRNKKTGEVVERTKIATLRYVEGDGEWIDEEYQTLAALNEEWEDYAPAEPLIKDEKVRKAVRAWAEIGDIVSVYYHDERLERTDGFGCIEFAGNSGWDDYLGTGEMFTIAELCGEEEEWSR